MPTDLCLLLPIYNDWTAAGRLVEQLDAELDRAQMPARVLLVDDGSTVRAGLEDVVGGTRGIRELRVLQLRRNLGHQRAICVGLAYVHEWMPTRTVVVMDADGEDLPEDVPRLVRELVSGRAEVVFAERRRRSEGLRFRVLYVVYRWLHRALTGVRVRFGNFSALSDEAVATLVSVSETWNHYAAAVLKARLPYATVPTDRGRRVAGRSSMGFQSLLVHGLSAFSVFADVVGARLLLAALGVLVVALFLAGCVVAVRVLTSLAVPGWATYTTLSLLIVALQALTCAGASTMVVLFSRNMGNFLPLRDYSAFVRTVYRWPGEILWHNSHTSGANSTSSRAP